LETPVLQARSEVAWKFQEPIAMAFDTYMQIDDGSLVAGDAAAVGIPPGSFEVDSFRFETVNPPNEGSSGLLGGRSGAATAAYKQLVSGRVEFSHFFITKKTDSASPILFGSCCAGQHFTKALVIQRRATGISGRQQTFVEFEFQGVKVVRVHWSGGSRSDQTSIEEVEFSFGKCHITHFSEDTADGQMRKTSEGSWDLKRACPL
jgi:type VI secretion system Hcp family effector